MNYFEIIKKENIGKSYEVIIDGVNKGIWDLKARFGEDEFELYREERPLSRIYFASQVVRMEFKEVINWSKVPVDTKVLVSNNREEWHKRHLYKYEDGKFLAWDNGKTSFTVTDVNERFPWEYAKLYQE